MVLTSKMEIQKLESKIQKKVLLIWSSMKRMHKKDIDTSLDCLSNI
ncbi:hypothetical protein LCGC14_0878890 [marine sediment metagenome]|uniref:Uncharacterized protein n=1 Tax=marine sediment metagenome TaxID=412755 RepID=A0A0F9PN56_9ZZZZ